MARIVSLESGMFYDASYTLLRIPEDLDLDKARKDWQRWYEEEYIPAFRGKTKDPVSFKDFTDTILELPGVERFEVEIYEG